MGIGSYVDVLNIVFFYVQLITWFFYNQTANKIDTQYVQYCQ